VKRLAGVVLVGMLLALTASCSSDDADDRTAASDERTTTSARDAAFEKGAKYVALGSSIASGFGIPEQSHCGRSTRSYPNQVATHYALELVDVTCGGAITDHIIDTPQGEDPPQIDSVTPDTELITITIGGNDIDYNVTALICSNPANECAEPAGYAGKLAALPDDLRTMVDQLEQRAPSATIVFVTYPREVPDQNCPALSFTDAEASIVRNIGDDLQDVFVDVLADDDRVIFVDPYVEDGDHTGCAPEDQRWAAGKEAPGGFPYHPTALGHDAMTKLILDALGRS
jgi:lysophospholipase L1-like esterase